MFEPTELRLFGAGPLEVRSNRVEMRGFLHAFDDFGLSGDTIMGSGFFQLVKVN